MATKKHRRTKHGRKKIKKQYKYVNFHGGKSIKNNTKRKGKGKKYKDVFIDIGMSRTRITGAPGMNQNLEVSRKLAQGMSQSLTRGMGQSLA